jgi:dTDP-4-dehydrorhamnose reductase
MGQGLKIALLGDKGMLGSEFANSFGHRGARFQAFNRDNFDLSGSTGTIAKQLMGFDLVLNCIAYTAVDRAESEWELAEAVNATFPSKLATASSLNGFKLIHFSTDYVFDGESPAPYRTEDKRSPQNAYGRSKLLGEDLIQASEANYAIFRTSWLYGQFGNCFPKTISRLAQTKNEVAVVNDQHGQPTWTRDVVDLVATYAQTSCQERIVHATSSGSATWFDFAQEICRSMGSEYEPKVTATTSDVFPTAAIRPQYSVLSHEDSQLKPIGDWAARWQKASALVLA